MFVCLIVHLFITRAPTPSRAAEPGREKESLVLGQGLLGRWRWDGEIEKEKERNSRREGGEQSEEGLGGASEKHRLSWLHLQSGHQGQTLSSEGVLPLAGFL